MKIATNTIVALVVSVHTCLNVRTHAHSFNCNGSSQVSISCQSSIIHIRWEKQKEHDDVTVAHGAFQKTAFRPLVSPWLNSSVFSFFWSNRTAECCDSIWKVYFI